MIGLKSQMCQSYNICVSYSIEDRHRKNLDENDRIMKKDDVSNTFNFCLLEKIILQEWRHVELVCVH